MNRAPVDTAAKLQRAKCRLYVAAQVGGWGAFQLFQFGVAKTFGDPARSTRDTTTETAIYFMITLLGLVLTHYARRFMEAWGWKNMHWRALTPRVVGMAALLAFLWCAVGYGYSYGIIGLPWPSKFNPVAVFFFSWINSLVVMFGWLSAYFFYHIFERLQRMQVEQLRLAASAKEAELRALKSQVNPHFLFNSLNSLRALIDEASPSRHRHVPPPRHRKTPGTAS